MKLIVSFPFNIPRMTRFMNRAALGLLLFGLNASIGCRSSGNPSGEGTFGKREGLGILGSDRPGEYALAGNNRDPLLGKHRIAPQNLPTGAAKDGTFYGSVDDLPADPLFRNTGIPTAPPAPKAASLDKPEQIGRAEPFRPGPGVTNAALAGNELVIDDRNGSVMPTGSIPFKPLENNAKAIPTSTTGPAPRSLGLSVDMLTEELRKIGGKPYAPVRLNNGQYEFRCSVPINDQGATRSYTGSGSTPLNAVRNVYEQIRTDNRP